MGHKEDGLEFLERNKTYDDIQVTASGLQYSIKTEGAGAKPSATDTVTVHYTGKLITNKVFDTSYGRGEPISFALNGVIKGWTEGLQLMSVGSIYTFYIPSELAYGEHGVPGVIPGDAVLIFEVELLEIN